MEIKVYKEGDAAVGAGIALKNRLYVPKAHWNLNKYLNAIKRGQRKNGVSVSIAFDDDNRAVGVAIQMGDGETQSFVRKDMRRQGIGTKLVDPLRKDGWWAGVGVDGSMNFWKNVGCKASRWGRLF